ncbi:MAG: prepilin-type N-terminal cleavage/methylation domain-containing protein [Kiritimatiellae bacterium]|nr:prepilin-type N-terminal cleavage/methylation domain-containing protein [Kiritimatiellia bacterium]
MKDTTRRFPSEAVAFLRGARGGFTLIELLVVVAIMAVMIAIALPRFEDIGRGSKMRAAINELRATIALARQWAVANREDTFLVFPDDQNAVYSGLSTNEHKKALRSYAVYSRSRGYLKDWTYLPNGVYFVDRFNSQQSTRPSSCVNENKNIFRQATLYYNPTNGIPFPTDTSGTKTINALRFTPQGWAVESSGSAIVENEMYLVEAIPLDATGGKVVNLVWKDNPVVWNLNVKPLTGIVRTIDCSQSP